MKKISLLVLLSVVLSVSCLFYFQTSKAQNKSSDPNSAREQPAIYPESNDKLKEVPQMVKNSKTAGVAFERRELFQSATSRAADDEQLREIVGDGVTLAPDKSAVQRILRENVEFLTLPLPDGKGGTLELELVKVNIFAPGFSVKTSSPTGEPANENLGVHYRGTLAGNERSLVAISIFKNEVMGFYSTEAGGNFVLGRLGGKNPTGRHILYAAKDLKVDTDFYCKTKDDGVRLPESFLQSPDEVMARCVRMYLEANYNLFQAFGSVSSVNAYVTGMFNQSATIFANEGIPIAISEIYVWNSPSPYTGADSSVQLDLFRNYRTSFNGDLAHLLSAQSEFGGRAVIGALCSQGNGYGFSGVSTSYNDFPIYSPAVFVLTHEIGHNLGSPHTHACAWNGNNTAIDSCGPIGGYPYEGGCSNAPTPPVNGGTIMSYCHLAGGVGINFSLGFGTQPGSLIVNRFNNAYCLSDCATTCAYQLSPAEATLPSTAGTGSFNVTTDSTCAWTASIYQPSILEMSSPLRAENLFSPNQDSAARKMFSDVRAVTETISRDSAPVIVDDGSLGGSGWLTITSGTSGTGNGTITYSVTANYATFPRTGRIWVGNKLYTVTQSPLKLSSRRQFDFDGDQRADLSVFRPSNSYWYISNSSNNSITQTQFGATGDLLAPADFDGDGKTDISVFRPSDGIWYRLESLNSTFSALQFGTNGDIPVPANYDNDGKADLAVYRPSGSIWYCVYTRSNQFIVNQFGIAGDKPVVGDYDGDDFADIAVYRPSNGTWYLLRTRQGFAAIQFGNSNDKPVVGDYDGDGKSDPAVFRPSDGTWYLLRSNLGFTATQFGNSTDLPAPADYDGDGKIDLGVYRDNYWYLLKSTEGFSAFQFGAIGDKPVPGVYVP